MTLKEMFDKEFLFEEVKKEKHPYKIFYKLDILLKKNKEAENNTQNAEVPPQPQDNQAAEIQPDANVAPQTAPIPAQTPNPVPVSAPEAGVDMSAFSSVVTEDNNEAKEITDDNVIIRKTSGEIVLAKDDVNNIQAIDDIYNIIKEKDENVLDDLSLELIQNLTATNQLQQELKDKIDIKDSSIFVEVIYGKKLDESVGIRLIKRKGSDLVTNSMLIDNQIVNFAFSKSRLDSKIVDMRNDEYSANDSVAS